MHVLLVILLILVINHLFWNVVFSRGFWFLVAMILLLIMLAHH
jgi:hypothetical protein